MTTRSLALLLVLGIARVTTAADVPRPEDHLGFRPGADFHLARWQAVVDYFRKVDDASDRVAVRELGRTAEDRPYVVAVVSAPETIADLGRYQDLQHRLADPRLDEKSPPSADPVRDSKVVVLITCSIHSTETASTLMAMELLHDLAAGDDAATKEVLDRTILLLVPSANPDGVEKVATWYERTRDKPWEGDGMPELYHKYAGHDTNRDWFMLNLPETRLLTHLLYKEWFPTLTYDVHQMGRKGARLFVPPFFDPINPNLDPRLHQGIALIGAHMAADLAREGKRGVLTHAMYDNWWNGGNRTTPQRHNMVGVLTEAASVRMASPIFLDRDELAGSTRGFADHRPAVNFVDPWPGGWWRLRDIVEYELICARSLLTLAARYRETFQANYRAMARDAIKKGEEEPPFAWVVPADQRDPGRAATMVRILHDSGVEVRRATSSFQAGAAEYPAGSWILPAAQPYRTHLKDMMERQVYPNRLAPDGSAEPPYDVAGWTLPLLMGVEVAEVADRFDAPAETVERVEPIRGEVAGEDEPRGYRLRNQADDDFIVLNALLEAGVAVDVVADPDHPNDHPLLIGADGRAGDVLRKVVPTVSTRVEGVADDPTSSRRRLSVRPRRIGVYQPWMPSMDEGWTRLVLEKFHFPYATLHNDDLRAGRLKDRVDAIVLASIDPKTLRDGYARDETEPRYVGGLAGAGVDALREFVEAGGTLVCLEESCRFAIDELGLPVREVTKGLRTSEFYGPGSILAARVTPDRPLTFGVPEDVSVYFERSLAFDVDEKVGGPKVLVRYAKTGVLQSGWLLGPEKVQDRAALVEVPLGKGHVVLFGFPPQFRGQTHGTFRLLFNALLRGRIGPS